MRHLVIRSWKIYRQNGLQSLLLESKKYAKNRLLLFVLTLFQSLIPDDENLLLFSGRHGIDYGGNSRYLYEFMIENNNNHNIEPIWITQDYNLYRSLSNKDHPVVYHDSIKGMYSLARANCGAFTHGIRDISKFDIRNSLKVIDLKHGLPVKAIGDFRSQSTVDQLDDNGHKNRADYYITTSKFVAGIWENGWGIDKETQYVTGYPRNDVLINPTSELENKWNAFFDNDPPETTVLYAPTQRAGSDIHEFEFPPFEEYDRKELLNFLTEKRVTLLFRLHPNDYWEIFMKNTEQYKKEYNEITNLCSSDNVFLINKNQNHFDDANEMLPFVDVLLTDYSSIYHDFLLLDRPILFAPYDYARFSQNRGFNYDYRDNLPGPEIRSMPDFFDEIEKVKNSSSEYDLRRTKLRNKIHTFQDSNSRKRVLELIESIQDENIK